MIIFIYENTWGIPAADMLAWLKNMRPKCSRSGKTSSCVLFVVYMCVCVWSLSRPFTADVTAAPQLYITYKHISLTERTCRGKKAPPESTK